MTIQTFSTLVFRLMAELEGVHTYNLEHRLTSFLLYGSSTDAKVQMTQQETASYLGTTHEVVAWVLGQLVAKKFIKTSRNQIEINDPAKLAQFINQ